MPTTSPSATPGADQGGDDKSKAKPPPETTLGIELEAGPNFRLDSPDAFTNDAPVGLAYGLGAWFAPSRVFSVGLAAQEIGLGSARTAPQGSNYEVDRSLTALWLGGRAYPLRTDTIGLFVQLQIGMSWQRVHATGTAVPADTFATPQAYDCTASSGPGFGLGGGVGMDVDLDRHLAFIAQGDLTAQRTASDPADLDGCAPGAGSETNLGARIGFMYRFDMDEKSSATARRKSLTSVSF